MPNTALARLLTQNGPILVQDLNQKLIAKQRQIYLPGIEKPFPKNEVIEEIKTWSQNHFPQVFSEQYFKQSSYSEQRFLQELSSVLNNLPQPEELKQKAEQIQKQEKAEQQTSRPSVAQLNEWQIGLEEYEGWRTKTEQTNTEAYFGIESLGVEEQLAIMAKFKKNMKDSGMSQEPISSANAKEAYHNLRKALPQAKDELIAKKHQQYQQKVINATKKQFRQEVVDWIKDKKLKDRVAEEVSKHGAVCAQKASELYVQYLSDGWAPEKAGSMAAKEALRLNMVNQPLYIEAALKPNQNKLEKNLSQSLSQNTKAVTEAQKYIESVIRPLEITTAPTHKETVSLLETSMEKSLRSLGFSETKINTLKSKIHQEAIRATIKLEHGFIQQDPNQAAFQRQFKEVSQNSLNNFLSPVRRARKAKQTHDQAQKISNQLSQIIYHGFKAQPSNTNAIQEYGPTKAQSLLTNPRLLSNYALSRIFPDSALTRFRIRKIAEGTNHDLFSLSAALSGHTSKTISNLIAGLESGQISLGLLTTPGINPNDPRIKKLQELAKELEKMEGIIKNPKGLNQWLFSLQAKINQARYKAFDVGRKINPFRPVYYAYDHIRAGVLEKVHKVTDPKIIHFREYKERLLRETRLGWVFAPRYRLGLKWKKYLSQHQRLDRFIKFLPRLKPNYWIKAGAKNFGRRVATGTGHFLLKHSKNTFLKALGSKLLALPVEAATGPAGWVIGAVTIVGGTINFLRKRENRQLIKEVGKLIGKALGGLTIAIYTFIKLFPWTTILGTAGSLLGPLGTAVGGGIGLFIDTTLAPWLSKTWAGFTSGIETIFSGSGLGGVVAPTATGLSSLFASPAIAAPVAVSGTLALAAFTIVSNSSSLVPPAGQRPPIEPPSPPWESSLVSIEKKAGKTLFTNEELTDSPEITYTITITPKKTITVNSIKDEINVFSSQALSLEPSSDPASAGPEGAISQPYSFEYSVVLNSDFVDSRVQNTIIISVSDEEGNQDTVSTYENILIGSPPAIDCPIALEDNPYIHECSYNSTLAGCDVAGYHGSNRYWQGSCGDYRVPVFDACWGPTDENKIDPGDGEVNVCWQEHSDAVPSELCPDYGKAMDVAPSAGGGTPVALPSINGDSSVVWNYERNSSSNWGYGHLFNASHNGNNYHLVIYHLNEESVSCQQCSPGDAIGTVYANMTRPHIHIELQINGSYVMPEFHMCQNLPIHN